MEKLCRLTTEDRENLAAYLDGELDDDATRRIESVLATNSVARNDVESLARTYEMLEALPRPKAPGDFTEKTVSMAKLESVRKSITDEPWFRTVQQSFVLVLWSAASIGIAALAFAATYMWVPTEDQGLIEEFPVIQQFDLYSEVNSDPEFVDQLANQPELLEAMQRMSGNE